MMLPMTNPIMVPQPPAPLITIESGFLVLLVALSFAVAAMLVGTARELAD